MLPDGHESFDTNCAAIGQRLPESNWYSCFNLPAVVGELFSPLGSVFRRNVDEEEFLSLVAIQPG